ncbi:MAG: undecaprenyl-diphosphate phosphatase [Bradymonadaceae bacterium]|nr:undecaprenyl-diphosphate phosphatase [Lujinxingiaceae bacterium]
MNFIEALLLGLLQGLTEFLPISSSGHLILGERFFGIPETQLLFNIVLHLGTLVAVTLFYRKDVYNAVTGFTKGSIAGVQTRTLEAFRRFEGARLAVLLVLATIPTGVIGVLINRLIEPDDAAPWIAPAVLPSVICAALIVNGFILMSTRFFSDDKAPTRESNWSLWNITPTVAILIGVAQGLAVLPGFSRSGLTITAAIWLGVVRIESARFSFLLSIPAVLGALVLKFNADLFTGIDGPLIFTMFIAAAAVAGVAGYLTLIVLVKMLKKAQFQHFAWYSWAVGIIGLILLSLY